jgi:hypothetical protein
LVMSPFVNSVDWGEKMPMKPFYQDDPRLGFHHIGKSLTVFVTLVGSLRFVTNAFPRSMCLSLAGAFAWWTFISDPAERGGAESMTSPSLLEKINRAAVADQLSGGVGNVRR